MPYDASASTPTGDELPAAELGARHVGGRGIAATLYYSSAHRANVVATLGMPGGQPRLLFMSHIDVVPVEDAAQWTYPPFGGEIHDGRLWGRGAADMKCTVAAEAMALIILKRAGVKLDGELIFATCADEESGGAYGYGWMAQHYPELLARRLRRQRRRRLRDPLQRPDSSTRSTRARRAGWKRASTSPAAATTPRSPGAPTTPSTRPRKSSGASAPTSPKCRHAAELFQHLDRW